MRKFGEKRTVWQRVKGKVKTFLYNYNPVRRQKWRHSQLQKIRDGLYSKDGECPICNTPMEDNSEYVDIGIGRDKVTHSLHCPNPYCYGYGEENSGQEVIEFLHARRAPYFERLSRERIGKLERKLPKKHQYPNYL